MKIILRILVILLAGTLVAGAVYLIIENSNAGSGEMGANGANQPPAMAEGQSEGGKFQERPEGGMDHHGSSFNRGLSEVLGILAKISGITIVVVLLQFVISRLRRSRKVITPITV